MNYSLEKINRAQSRMIVDFQKENSELKRRIRELEQDKDFLTKALGMAMKSNSDYIVIDNSFYEKSTPEFSLYENIGGDMVIMVKKHG